MFLLGEFPYSPPSHPITWFDPNCCFANLLDQAREQNATNISPLLLIIFVFISRRVAKRLSLYQIINLTLIHYLFSTFFSPKHYWKLIIMKVDFFSLNYLLFSMYLSVYLLHNWCKHFCAISLCSLVLLSVTFLEYFFQGEAVWKILKLLAHLCTIPVKFNSHL